ncbi:hypothetical protein ABFT23_02215 [Nocardioides sp. C4-1]|uniref:hypothetical protein n=1 Tax=Nocardioides sp. C4-1 TaxID=3151851 RepID=UPI003266B557
MENHLGGLLVRAWAAQTGGDPAGSVYDEVLRAVSARAAADGSLGKADIGGLVLWKRITAQATWATRLMETPDSVVREATAAAYVAANDETVSIPVAGQVAWTAMRPLPGMGGAGALRSAVLLALSPTRMAVWDRRVAASLTALGRLPKYGDGFYERYLTTLLDLAGHMGTSNPDRRHTPRDVDLALFNIAGDPTLLDEAAGRGG